MGADSDQCAQSKLRAVVLCAQMRSHHLDQARMSKGTSNLRGSLI